MGMSEGLDSLLRSWPFKPGAVQARLAQGEDGRQVIQMRVDLGILQMETNGRPDGVRPHGAATFFEYLKQRAQAASRRGRQFKLDENQCQEADREFVQFYHRRLAWLALQQFARAVSDADHTLAFMDFVRDHSPSDEFTHAHEQYRGFVTFQRTQASAALAVERGDPERAIDEIRSGLGSLRAFFTSYGLDDQLEDNGMVQQLRTMEDSLRQTHGIKATLQEQLDRAVANEQYEEAARLRDAIKRRA
jgi:hypothetical protein